MQKREYFPLNDEQKKLVEENHNLIYWYCHKNNLSVDEYYDMLAIELCKAVQTYDSTKSKISTYISQYFWHRHVSYDIRLRNNVRKANINALSLDEELIDGEDFQRSKLLTNGKSVEDELIMVPLSECGLSDKLMEVVKLRLDNPNITQREMGEILGIGQVQVGRRLKAAERIIKEAWCISD